MLPKQKIPYDVIIGRYLTEELQMDVIYSEYVAVQDGVILTM